MPAKDVEIEFETAPEPRSALIERQLQKLKHLELLLGIIYGELKHPEYWSGVPRTRDFPTGTVTLTVDDLGPFDRLRHVNDELLVLDKDEADALWPALFALARLRQAEEIVEDFDIAVTTAAELMSQELRQKLADLNYLLITDLYDEASFASEFLLHSKLSLKQRNIGTIRRIRRSARDAWKMCGLKILAAQLEINRLVESIDRQASEPDKSVRDRAKRARTAYSPKELEACRQLYLINPETTKEDIERELQVGSNKAQALREQMRAEDLDQSKPRRKRSQ